jgi:hypothetical protein
MRPIIKIHNTETGEVIEREYNDEEYAQHLIDVENERKSLLEKTKAEADKAALLAKLGITADEARLLLS